MAQVLFVQDTGGSPICSSCWLEATSKTPTTGDWRKHAIVTAELQWRCIGGHEPWQNNTFRFQLTPHADGRTQIRFRQDYAVELDDDAYATYNYNLGYYLESLRLLCETGTGKPFGGPQRGYRVSESA